MKSKKIKFVVCGIFSGILIYILITTFSICIYSQKDEKCDADVAIILGASASEAGVSLCREEFFYVGYRVYRLF